MKKNLTVVFLSLLYCFYVNAQAPFNESIDKGLRINLYPAALWGDNLYPGTNGTTTIAYSGAGITTEVFNYHFLNVTNFSFLQTDNKQFQMMGLRNTFSYFISDAYKITAFAGFASSPINSHIYSIDSVPNVDNTGNYLGSFKPYVISDSLEVKKNADYFIHYGAFFKTNNHSINWGVGGIFLYRPEVICKYYPWGNTQSIADPSSYIYSMPYPAIRSIKTRPSMRALQLNASVEFFKNRAFSATLTPGFQINALLKDHLLYVETELSYRPSIHTQITLNANTGSSRFLYALVDGGYMIYNEDILRGMLGLKISQSLSNRIELMAKAEWMRFRLADTYSYYAGIKYALKEF